MTIILDGSTGITAPTYNGSVASEYSVPVTGFKNRVINGAMVIDQRNAGASKTITDTSAATYTLDRWFAYGSQASKFSVQQNAGSVTPPAGFINYAGITSLSAYSVGASELFQFCQRIEGLNFTDLAWGTANAKTVTLSFQVYSSLTGTFGGALLNSAGNRSYPFSYSIPVANTWTTISIPIAGDTSGTWLTTNGTAVNVNFSLGTGSSLSGASGSWAASAYFSATGATSVVGTNGATFYITGVQLEKGSTATSFDYRPYGTELALCQRYYHKWVPVSPRSYCSTTNAIGASNTYGSYRLPVTMRTTPTLTTSGTGADYGGYSSNSAITCSGVATMDTSNVDTPLLQWPSAAAYTVGQVGIFGSASINGFLGFNAEL